MYFHFVHYYYYYLLQLGLHPVAVVYSNTDKDDEATLYNNNSTIQ
jgi:hypothetical protein